jgi:hypothetical protein
MTRAKGGRPKLDRPTGRKVTLYMLPPDEAKAKKIGAGNLSAGVRKALSAYGPNVSCIELGVMNRASDSGTGVKK